MSIDFFRLCFNGHLEEAKEVFEQGQIDLEFKDPGGRTTLAMTAGKGHVDVVRWLIELGSPVDELDREGRTALARAAVDGFIDVMQVLIQAGADVNMVNRRQESILTDAILCKQEKAALFLIDSGADIHAVNKHGRTALHWAAEWGYASVVKTLLERGAQVDRIDSSGVSPLDLAKRYHKYDVKDLLLQAVETGRTLLDTVKTSEQRISAVDEPVEANRPQQEEATIDIEEKFFVLCQAGKLEEAKGHYASCGGLNDGVLAKGLSLAMDADQFAIVKWLVSIGVSLAGAKKAQPTQTEALSEEADQLLSAEELFWELFKKNELDEAKALWEANEDEFAEMEYELKELLISAVQKNQPEIVKWLIALGTSLYFDDYVWDEWPLVIAVKHGRAEIMKLLLEAGHEAYGKLLSYAIKLGRRDIAEMLILNGADLTKGEVEGETPLHEAAKLGDIGLVQLLIEKGALVTALDYERRTPAACAVDAEIRSFLVEKEQALRVALLAEKIPTLYAAIETKDEIDSEEMVRYYIDRGADIHQLFVDVQKEEISSLLSLAIQNNNVVAAKLLIEAGIDVNERFLKDEDFFEKVKEILATEGYQLKERFYKSQELNEVLVRAYEEAGQNLSEDVRNVQYGVYQSDYMVQAIAKCAYGIMKLLLEAGFNLFEIPVSMPNSRVYHLGYYALELVSRPDFSFKTEDFSQLEEILFLFLDQQLSFDLKSLQMIMDGMNDNRNWLVSENLKDRLFRQCLDLNEPDNSGRTLLHLLLSDKQSQNEKNDFLTTLLDQDGLDVNLFDYQDFPPLYYACMYQDAHIVRRLLEMGAEATALCGSESLPLTAVAAQAKKQDILQVLCEYGADVNVTDDKGQSLLHRACADTDFDWIKLLVKAGADVSATNNNGNTPLHLLLSEGLVVEPTSRVFGNVSMKIQKPLLPPLKKQALIKEMIDLLLENGAELDAFNHDLRTPFFLGFIASGENTAILEHLLSLGAMIDVQDKHNNTCLHLIAVTDQTKKVKFLLDAGVDAHIQNSEGKTPYQLALENNRRATISMIEKSGAAIMMDGDDLDVAFMRACKNGKRGVAEMLVRSGNIDITYVDDLGRTSLHYIAKLGMVALAKFMIDQGVDVDYTDNVGQTALHFAAGSMYQEVFKLLVDVGANLNIADEQGVLPIHLVTNRGQHDLLGMLLENGVLTDVNDNEGRSLLHMACYTRSRECVRILLEHGVNPNSLDDFGDTPLIASVNINQKEIVQMLLSHGADIKRRNANGNTGLHIAVIRGFKDMIALLLENGNEINEPNNHGLAPLHLAAYYGKKDIFKFLLDKGADFELKTAQGKSCVDIAAENGQKELIELIGIIQKRRELK